MVVWARAHAPLAPPRGICSNTPRVPRQIGWFRACKPRCNPQMSDEVASEPELILIGGGCLELPSSEDASETMATHHHWRMFSDVQVLDGRTLAWSCVLPDGGAMPARRGHSAALHHPSQTIVIFGGVGAPAPTEVAETDAYLNDVWVLRTQPEYAWEKPDVNGSPPAPRRGHRAAMLADGGTMVVLGGYPSRLSEFGEALTEARLPIDAPRASGGNLIGVFALRMESWAWEHVHVDGHVPRGLALFGCACEKDRVFIFGGHEFIVIRERRCVGVLWTADLSELRTSGGGAAAGGAAAPPVVHWEVAHAEYVDPATRRANNPAAPPEENQAVERAARVRLQ